MNEIQVFNNTEFGEIRTVEIDNEVWFVGKDVAAALGYERDTKAVTDHVDEEDCKYIDGKTQSHFGFELGQRGGWLINESGVYALVFNSKLPKAKEFKKWVTHEVLPSIRKHGAYMTPQKIEEVLLNPDTIIKLATDLKAEREHRMALETKIEQDKPKTIFADAVSSSKTSILIGDMAKLLRQNGIEIGQKRLFDWLRNNGYLIKRKGSDWNMPTQRSVEMGLFEIKESTHLDGNGCNITTKTSKVTGKGQVYFINKFLKATV